MDWKKFGFKLLDGFTRTWASFWGTWAFIVFWCFAPAFGLHFDPPPYLLLMGVITVLSYMQNIVIMTELKEEKQRNDELEEIHRKMFAKMFDMVDELHEEIVDAERQHEDEVSANPKKARRWLRRKKQVVE